MSVAANVHPRLYRFPATVNRRLGLQARIHPKVVEQPIRLERQQILRIELLSGLEWPGQQPDGGKSKGRRAPSGGGDRGVVGTARVGRKSSSRYHGRGHQSGRGTCQGLQQLTASAINSGSAVPVAH